MSSQLHGVSGAKYPYDMLLSGCMVSTIPPDDSVDPKTTATCQTCSKDKVVSVRGLLSDDVELNVFALWESLKVLTSAEKKALYGQCSVLDDVLHWIYVRICQQCSKQLVVWVNDCWWSWEDCLKTGDTNKDGITEVAQYADRFVLYILSQICHSPQDDGITFAHFSPTEHAKLVWNHGEVMGFYTVKPKGSPYSGSLCDFYALSVLDTIYVRPCGRRQGLATLMLRDALGVEAPYDFGFSSPVSKPMMAVLLQFLLRQSEWRDHLWEVTWTGGQGYRQNVWLNIQAIIRQHRQTVAAEAQL